MAFPAHVTHHGAMTNVLLYPTETLYALGVNALDVDAIATLQLLKGRGPEKPASWLVRSVADIERYAEVDAAARSIADTFLPGPLTLILRAHKDVPTNVIAADGTIGFRISRDPIAEALISEYMDEHDTPLTATSANVSGAPTLPTPDEILQQFGPHAADISRVIDDGPRKGLASTIVRILDGKVTVLREGEIAEAAIIRAVQ